MKKLFIKFCHKSTELFFSIKAKHLYILPYFGYQVFDFTVTSLMAISYYSWIPNANDFVNNNVQTTILN